jgi:hypothetical protein
VATRPERRPRDQDRRGAARCRPIFPIGIGTKAANRRLLIAGSVPFIPRSLFLHFTLNHYMPLDAGSRCAIRFTPQVAGEVEPAGKSRRRENPVVPAGPRIDEPQRPGSRFALINLAAEPGDGLATESALIATNVLAMAAYPGWEAADLAENSWQGRNRVGKVHAVEAARHRNPTGRGSAA